MALYNGGFPATYQPIYPQYQPPVQQQNGIIWVQGEAGAKSYLVAPNSTVQLWDSERQTIYLKSADASGMPTMKVLDYSIRQTDKTSPDAPPTVTDGKTVQYATKAEIDGVLREIETLKHKVAKMTKKTEVEDDE